MKEDKDKIVSWAVSNCKTSSQREDYIKELSKFININQVKYLNLTITQIFKKNFWVEESARDKYFLIMSHLNNQII